MKLKDRLLNTFQKVMGGKNQVIVNNVRVAPPERGSADIDKWRNAIKFAEGYSQQRKQLFDLYEDMMLDGYLQACIKRRVDQVTNKELEFVLPDGTVVEEVSALADKTFFEDFLKEVLNAQFWGHSLIEPLWPAFGSEEEGMTMLVPRKHVKPRFKMVTKEAYDMEGIDYSKPPYRDRVIEVGKPESLGLLMSVSQYVIYKRGNFGDWAEFVEIFGIPFRWATYNNEQSRVVLEEALQKAGPAGYVVAPNDANLEFLNGDSRGTGSDIFAKLREACNEEIGLAVLGNTMTSIESSAGGYAQSETQSKFESELCMADRRMVLRILNEKLIPFLARLGYPVQGGRWQFRNETSLSLSQRIDVDLKVATQVDVPSSYWYDTYGIPKPEGDEPTGGDDPPDDDDPPEDDPPEDDPPSDDPPREFSIPKKKSRVEQIAELHGASCCKLSDAATPVLKPVPAAVQRAVQAAVAAGSLELNENLHRHYYSRIRNFVRAGYGSSLGRAADAAAFELQQGLLRSVSSFAAGKQHALIEELSSAYKANPANYDRKAREILKRHNSTWLETEAQTLEASANMASQWQEFEERADIYPNLRFSTVGDDRVRPAHAALDGAVYPVNSSFWNSHTPPLEWRCRCVLIQTDEAANELPGEPARKGFGINPNREKKLIGGDHPYYRMPGDELAAVMETAEKFRAAIERPGIVKLAEQQRIELGGRAVQPSPANVRQVLDQPSSMEGVRNAILGALGLLASSLQPSGAETWSITLLGQVFQLKLVERAGNWEIESLVAI